MISLHCNFAAYIKYSFITTCKLWSETNFLIIYIKFFFALLVCAVKCRYISVCVCVADKCNVNHWYSGVIGFVFITHSTQETERKAYSVLVKSTTSIYLSSCHCYNIIGIINVHWPKSSPSLSSAVLCRHNRVCNMNIWICCLFFLAAPCISIRSRARLQRSI